MVTMKINSQKSARNTNAKYVERIENNGTGKLDFGLLHYYFECVLSLFNTQNHIEETGEEPHVCFPGFCKKELCKLEQGFYLFWPHFFLSIKGSY